MPVFAMGTLPVKKMPKVMKMVSFYVLRFEENGELVMDTDICTFQVR